MLLCLGTIFTITGRKILFIPKVNQRVFIVISDDHHISTSTSVTSIRPSPWNVGLSSEAHGAASAVAGQAVDRDAVEEHTERSREEELP